MRSLSFGAVQGYAEIPSQVLELFGCLLDNPQKEVKYASEIISNGMQNRIRLDGSFNLDAYEATISKNSKLSQSKNSKKCTFLEESTGDFEDLVTSGGISIDIASTRVVDKVEDAFEKLLDEEELHYALSVINDLHSFLAVEEKVDFTLLIKQAIRGIPESVKKLKEICEKYSVVGEQVEIILSSGYSVEELFVCP